MSITSDQLNFLVYRYLQESGFLHSAFTFGYESFVHKSNINGSTVPPGTLISFIQKGLQYLELEANLNEAGEVSIGEYTPLSSQDMLTRDTPELKSIVKTQRDQVEKEKVKDKERQREEERQRERDFQKESRAREREPLERKADNGIKPMDEDKEYAASNHNGGSKSHMPGNYALIPESQVTTLTGHTSEVFICAWSPASSLLASGSGDSTARIWCVPGGDVGTVKEAITLKHFNRNKDNKQEKSKDVTTLDWNGDGTLLATGSYDGQARIWSRDGKLRNTLNQHKGPIFSLKWNKKGDCLLSGSVDRTAIIWDAKTGEVKQQFEHHSAPTLDVDWRNNVSFATCSTDEMIYVCKLGETTPLRQFQGHKDEVNAIKWDPSGNLLASCSDDKTAKIWSLKQETCIHDLVGHSKEIYTIKWSPTGPNSNNPNGSLTLASASFDSTIKLWDVDVGECFHSLTKHTEPVYSVAFSPNGEFLASGSFDKCVHIW
eukprot:CAMPEP_0196572704 /NCGR_PEP_ID=MMETSP1081-20130531/2698_1 /TAXON_ID=36882 /ORGANISM="Pyramimonas amylifera, Strain CCMP720" /LENGTH=488 /DNA_ID=CAMNT_0041890107 /DNA_START=606 /DNA_END=2069 /DNA_ORIENTATION=+